jgi:methylphosphotriester-DNA--protein-cysteine methyltransferase
MALAPWMLALAWRIERFRTLLTNGSPFITEATAHSGSVQRSFSRQKVDRLLEHRFRTAEEAVANVVDFVEGRRAY